jgi:Homeodomain-like domain
MLMPFPIAIPVRQAIFERRQRGQSVGMIAVALGLKTRTVRHLVRRFAQRGPDGLAFDYVRCVTKPAPSQNVAYRQALQLRQEHAGWGAGLIRVMLRQAQVECPSERTLQRWFRQAEAPPAPPGRRPDLKEERARRPHEVWQMDAAEQIALANRHRVSWLRVVDECSGAVLQTSVFPRRAMESGQAARCAKAVAPDFFAVGTTRAIARR